jgi:hypothetical protein
MNVIVLFLAVVVVSVSAFTVTNKKIQSFQLNSIPGNTFVVAELYASPAAKYNGVLVSESLKAVPAVSPKPAGNYF